MDAKVIEKYKKTVLDQLPFALDVYKRQYSGDPSFYSNNLKYRDALYEFRYTFMVYVYYAPRDQLEKFWLEIQARAERLVPEDFESLKQDVLVNVALAKAFRVLDIKFSWVYAENIGYDYATFGLMNAQFAHAIPTDGAMKVVTVTPQTSAHVKGYPRNMQEVANISQKKGYCVMLPVLSYDMISGELNRDVVKEVAKLKLPTVQDWQAEVQDLHAKNSRV